MTIFSHLNFRERYYLTRSNTAHMKLADDSGTYKLSKQILNTRKTSLIRIRIFFWISLISWKFLWHFGYSYYFLVTFYDLMKMERDSNFSFEVPKNCLFYRISKVRIMFKSKLRLKPSFALVFLFMPEFLNYLPIILSNKLKKLFLIYTAVVW